MHIAGTDASRVVRSVSVRYGSREAAWQARLHSPEVSEG